jgi:hypothetical protein
VTGKIMADFEEQSVSRNVGRKLATPFASKNTLNTLINTILTDNPWGCTSYVSGGSTLPAVSKSSEYYSGTIIYENTEGKQVGKISVRSKTAAGFDTNIATILGNSAIETAMGGSGSHDSSTDSFHVTLKCHSSDGELFNVNFKRDKVAITSFESVAIQNTIETWADTIPELA